MKRILTAIALLGLLALPVAAQLSTNQLTPPTAQSLPTTVIDYFTSFNTNLTTFSANRFSLWTGADSIQGGFIPLVNELGGSYDLWRPTPATGSSTMTALSLEAVSRNGGVAGTMVSDQGGLGFSVIVWDVRATVYCDGGYNLLKEATHDKFYGEAGLRVWKAIGQHFFAGVGMATQFPTSAQVFMAQAGATF